MTKYVSTPSGSLQRVEGGRWTLTFANERFEFDLLSDALIEFDALASEREEDGYVPEYHVDLEDFVDDDTARQVGSLFGWSGDGRSYVDGCWFPSSFMHEFDGPGDNAVYETGELGIDVTLCEWEGVFLLTTHRVAYGEVTERALGAIALGDAIEIADAEVEEGLFDTGLYYSPSIGLENLAATDQFVLPPASALRRRYSLYVGTDDMELKVRADVYRSASKPHAWMATLTDDHTVIGVFSTENEVERAVESSLTEAGMRRGGLEVEVEEFDGEGIDVGDLHAHETSRSDG